MQLHGQSGDHAQGPLRAEDHLPQIGPGRRLGRAPDLERALRRGHPERHHEIVEAAVAGRGLPARARGREAAERGVFVRLREVTDRVAALAQQRLGLRRPQPRLENGELRFLIELEQRVHPPEIEGDRTRE